MSFLLGFLLGYLACPVSGFLLALLASVLSNLYFALRREDK